MPTQYPSEHPTKFPTNWPTLAPTHHPCDDSSHGCDKGEGGECYKSEDGSNGWTCGCKNDHWCLHGCASPHANHECVLNTAAPTETPTGTPTQTPTRVPTKVPTEAPTKIPTHLPTHAAPKTNPSEKPVYHVANFVNVDVSHNAASTPPPTSQPTSAPTPAGYVMVKETSTATAVAVEFSFPISAEELEGTNGALVKKSMEEGFAAALAMPATQVKISSIGGRRLLEASGTKVTFEITSFSTDLVAVAKLEAHIEEASAEGSLVANMQKKAMENGVLSAAMASMPRSMVPSSLKTTTVARIVMVAKKATICTSDMFSCSGGDMVGRIGQDCHFATCPEYLDGGTTTGKPTKQPTEDPNSVNKKTLSAILANKKPTAVAKSTPKAKSAPTTDTSTSVASSLLNPAKLTAKKSSALVPEKTALTKKSPVVPAKTAAVKTKTTSLPAKTKTTSAVKTKPVSSSTLSNKQTSWLDQVNAYLKPTKTKPTTAKTAVKSTPTKTSAVKTPVKITPTKTKSKSKPVV